MNFEEFLISLKDSKLCYDYEIKFKNKYTTYIERERLERKQYMADKNLSEEEFLSIYSENWDADWFYIGDKIESFYTEFNLDFNSLASSKEILWNSEYEAVYKNYVIQDIWEELCKIQGSERLCYGIYVFSQILSSNGKQDILRNDFKTLLQEILEFKTEEFISSESLLSKYLKENSGFKCLFGHIIINISNDKLGQGGNGVVYAGKLGSAEVAVKFLVNYSSKKLERFKAEYININMIKDKLVCM